MRKKKEGIPVLGWGKGGKLRTGGGFFDALISVSFLEGEGRKEKQGEKARVLFASIEAGH